MQWIRVKEVCECVHLELYLSVMIKSLISMMFVRAMGVNGTVVVGK